MANLCKFLKDSTFLCVNVCVCVMYKQQFSNLSGGIETVNARGQNIFIDFSF